jgi:serine/threonine-protein kinase
MPVRVGLKLPPPAPPRFSLRLKIFLAAALLILIAVGGAIVVSTYQARRVADAKIAEDLKKSGPAWESFLQNRYGELHRALGVVVSNPGIISLMTLDPLSPATTIDTLRAEQASNARADFLLAADRKGVVFARTDKPLGYTADLSGVPTIGGALQGESTQGIWLSGGKLYNVVAAPVVEGGNRVVGAIAAGFQINDDVARNLKALMNTEVVFLANPAAPSEPPALAVAASTMQDVSPALLEAVKRRRELVDAVFRQSRTIGPLPLELSGDTFLGYFLPIRSSTDQIVGAAVPLRSRDKELAAFRQIQNTQLLVGLAALVVAFLLSFVLSRRITGPVDRLLRATEQVRVGNLEGMDLPVESRTRSASSPAPSTRCSRSSRRKRRSRNTSTPSLKAVTDAIPC